METESSALAGNAPINSDQVICTLYEGDYHLGVAVLINSIVRGGFRGLFWVGYRGELPPWVIQLSRRQDGLYVIGEALLGFEKIESKSHFTQYKPEFMTSLIARGLASNYLWYFDPDITVRCAWEFFVRWVRHGICLCQEITMGVMPSDHPIRCEWIELAERSGWGQLTHPQERYYNGGFLGMQVAHAAFLETWRAAMRLANSSGVHESNLWHSDRSSTFFATDQDALNLAVMYAKAPLSTIGPEGMGFVPGGFTMDHTAGGSKPWRKKFLKSALSGNPPWKGDKHFLECAGGPIKPYSDRQLWGLRCSAKVAALIGRFYHRN